MRSEVITIMAPEDEAAFLGFVFERPTVYLIPEDGNSTPEIPHTRDVRAIRSMHCMLWDKAILPRLQVEHVPSGNDYHLRSGESLIQFLRSRSKTDSILAGRIALSTGRRGGPDTDPKTARAMTVWYNAIARWIKSNFKNSFVYASDFKPRVGSRARLVWVGPRAIEMSLQGVKLKQNGPPEYSLHYFDPVQEDSVMAGYRKPERFIGIGRVIHVGDVVPDNQKQIFRVAIEKDAPFSEFEGIFRCFGPEPRLGDEVACVFSENVVGRHTEPWEPDEIKKLTPLNRERVLEGLRKRWRA